MGGGVCIFSIKKTLRTTENIFLKIESDLL